LPVAVGKTVAELTSRQDGMIRQQLIEQLMREIMNYDAQFRREDAAGAIACGTARRQRVHAKKWSWLKAWAMQIARRRGMVLLEFRTVGREA
jgi:hypothetical protein